MRIESARATSVAASTPLAAPASAPALTPQLAAQETFTRSAPAVQFSTITDRALGCALVGAGCNAVVALVGGHSIGMAAMAGFAAVGGAAGALLALQGGGFMRDTEFVGSGIRKIFSNAAQLYGNMSQAKQEQKQQAEMKKQLEAATARKAAEIFDARVGVDAALRAQEQWQIGGPDAVARRTAQEIEKRIAAEADPLVTQAVAAQMPRIVTSRVEQELSGPRAAEIEQRVAKGVEQSVESKINDAAQLEINRRLAQEVERRSQEAITGERAPEIEKGVEAAVQRHIDAQAEKRIHANAQSSQLCQAADTYLKLGKSQVPTAWSDAEASLKVGLEMMALSPQLPPADKRFIERVLSDADKKWLTANQTEATPQANIYAAHAQTYQYYGEALTLLSHSRTDRPASLDPQLVHKFSDRTHLDKVHLDSVGLRYRSTSGYLRSCMAAMAEAPETDPSQKALITKAMDMKMSSWKAQTEHYQAIFKVLSGTAT